MVGGAEGADQGGAAGPDESALPAVVRVLAAAAEPAAGVPAVHQGAQVAPQRLQHLGLAGACARTALAGRPSTIP